MSPGTHRIFRSTTIPIITAKGKATDTPKLVVKLQLILLVISVFFFSLWNRIQTFIRWIEIEFEYKASIAEGGESSNQITSFDTSLAYLASKWATKLALLFTHLSSTHLRPLSKQLASLKICPSRENKEHCVFSLQFQSIIWKVAIKSLKFRFFFFFFFLKRFLKYVLAKT